MGNTATASSQNSQEAKELDSDDYDDQIQKAIGGQLDAWGIKYVHVVDEIEIDCPHILQSNTDHVSNCPIYRSMKNQYQYNKQNLNHLRKYHHFQNEIQEKPRCKYGDECKTYIRCESGQDENRIDDQCHMAIFRHPPRTQRVQLAQNMHSFIFNQSHHENNDVYKPTASDKQKYGHDQYGVNKSNSRDGWLQALIDEVVSNGYKYDLCLKCKKDDFFACRHNVHNSKYSILKIVDEKMNCHRHRLIRRQLTRASMLALVLYTGIFYELS